MALNLSPSALAHGAALAFRFGLDAILPPRCLGCGIVVPEVGDVCPVCWTELRFVGEGGCRACARPLADTPLLDPVCASCAVDPPLWDRARAALVYEGLGRSLILRFKHGDRLEGVGSFGRWMAKAGREVLQDADLVVPVPVHRWRLLKRGYNQAALLARAAATNAGRRAAVDLLVRRRATGSQQGLSAEARRENVTAAVFAVNPLWRTRLHGRRVVLVDDVLTTGATLEGCARVLERGGALGIDVLVLARVPGPG